MNETNLILNLAPTGMVPTKQMTPSIPLSIDEVVSDIEKCAKLGVSMDSICKLAGRSIATPSEVRSRLGLQAMPNAT